VIICGFGDCAGDDVIAADGVESGLGVVLAADAEGFSAVGAGEFPVKNRLPAGTAGVLGWGCGRVRETGAGCGAAVPFRSEPVVAGLAAAATVGPVAAADVTGADVFGAGVDEAVPRAAREAETGGFAAFRGLVGWGLVGVAGFFVGGGSTAGSSVKPPALRAAFAEADLGSEPGAADGVVTSVGCSDAAPPRFPALKNITEA